MPLILDPEEITAKTVYSGFEEIELSAGQKFQIRHGNLGNPVEMYLGTVPQGKKWKLTASIYIEETQE